MPKKNTNPFQTYPIANLTVSVQCITEPLLKISTGEERQGYQSRSERALNYEVGDLESQSLRSPAEFLLSSVIASLRSEAGWVAVPLSDWSRVNESRAGESARGVRDSVCER